MRELTLIAGTMAVALGVIAVAVGPGHDTMTFVSPPEAVAEEFVRQLATGRYDRAVDHLENKNGAEPMVTVQGESLRRQAGEVNQVEGEEGSIDGDTATASTRITTSNAGELEWNFSLVRREGTWKISDWRSGPQ
jgi:hypothetical protein